MYWMNPRQRKYEVVYVRREMHKTHDRDLSGPR